MKIKVNGKEQEVKDGKCVAEFVDWKLNYVTVELNGKIIASERFTEPLKEGDEVNLMYYMGGGSCCGPSKISLSIFISSADGIRFDLSTSDAVVITGVSSEDILKEEITQIIDNYIKEVKEKYKRYGEYWGGKCEWRS